MLLINALADRADAMQRRWPGCVVLRQAGNDYTTVQFGPTPNAPAAEHLAAEFASYAASIAPRHPALASTTWWKITRNGPASGPPHQT